MENIEEEKGLTLQDIIFICGKHLVMIIILVCLGLAGGFGYGKYKDMKSPSFQVSSSLLISDTENNKSQSDVQTYQLASYLSSTIQVFLTEEVVLEKVVAELDDKYPELTIRGIQNSLSISTSTNSLILEVTYEATSVQKAVDVINTVCNKAVEVANTKNDSGVAKYRLLEGNLAVLTEATVNRYTKKSPVLKFTVIGFAGGIVLAFLYVLLRELFDNKFKNTEEIERTLGIPVLSGVSRYEYEEKD